MHILIVHAQIKPEFVEAFIEATKINARESAKEPGVARFDFLQQKDDPTRIVIYEVYRDARPRRRTNRPHITTNGRRRWSRLFVAPRTRAFYLNVAPGDEGFLRSRSKTD